MFAFPRSIPRTVSLVLIMIFFTTAGIMHFAMTDFFVAIMPPYLPLHLEAVYISGVFEILGGVGVMFGATRLYAGYGLLALLVAVYPANIHMALNPELFPDTSATALYARLPVQFAALAWVWWATSRERDESATLDPVAGS
ncbi:MAG: hypothetical protein ABGY42_07650 [bacterium]